MSYEMEVIHKSLVNIILLWIITFEFTYALSRPHQDVSSTVEETIKKYNYPFEKHTVQTQDGYILELHRIPNNKFKNRMKDTPPVLLFSGFLADSTAWIVLGPQKGLGFILADHGYDVWMGNNRGTTLCKKHVFLDPYKDKKKFWNFSFQELGYYDIPATIDHILNVTKQEQLMYLGHSQGATSYLAMLSEKPDYNSKIKFAIALAPVTSLQNSISIFIQLSMQNVNNVKNLLESYSMYELFPRSKTIIRFADEHCMPNSSLLHICTDIFCNLVGGNMDQLNKSTMHLLLRNAGGGSLKEGLHYLQLNKGIFRKYNYGEKENFKLYGQDNPPIYNLSSANVPIAIFYGSSDIFASQKDIELLALKLPNIIGMKMIPNYNHIDLNVAVDAPKLVFRDILKLLKMYS